MNDSTTLQLVLNKQQLNTDAGVNKLIHFVKQLPVNFESFKCSQKVIQQCGLPILIYLKPFYQRVQFKGQASEQKKLLQQLSYNALSLLNGKKIYELNFMFGRLNPQQKIKEGEGEKQYLKFLEQLTSLNEQIRNHKKKMSQTEYQKLIHSKIKQNQFSKLMLKSIEEYQLSSNHFDSNNSENDSEGSSDSQCGKNNFYTMDDTTDQTTDQTTITDLNVTQNSHNNTFLSLTDSSNNTSLVNESYYLPNNSHICCIKNFKQGQMLQFKPGVRVEFMEEKYPFSTFTITKIKKICCSFLNTEGGFLLIGVERIGPNYCIKHQIYSEQHKEDILKLFRQSFDRIEPDITVKKKYKVQFVPVKKSEENGYIQGGFIIRVKFQYGVRNEIYSYSEEEADYFSFRTEEGIQLKQGRKLLKFHKSILEQPSPIPPPMHPGQCESPDLGQILYNTTKTKKTSKKGSEVSFDTSNISVISKSTNHTQNSRFSDSFSISSKSSSDKVKTGEGHQLQQEVLSVIKQQKEVESYFFAEGLDEKDLEPLLKKYNLYESVTIEAYSPKKIIISVKPQATKGAKSLFHKIEKKYPDKIIITHITLRIRVDLNVLKQVLEELEVMKSKYKFYGTNILSFQKMLDSFQAFVLVQNYRRSISFISI